MDTDKLQFRLTVTCENAAFAEQPTHEIARILRVIAHELERGEKEDFYFYRTAHDINGNDVGGYALKDAKRFL